MPGDRVVEHAVGRARRGARRLQVGGGDGLHHRVGSRPVSGDDLAHELVPRHGRLVGEVVHAAAPVERDRRSTGARSAVNVGCPTWSATNASVGCSLDEAQHGLHHVVAVLAAHPRGAHDGRRRPERQRLRSPISLVIPYTLCGLVSSHSWYGRSSVPSNT
jgi:hypothetical protein